MSGRGLFFIAGGIATAWAGFAETASAGGTAAPLSTDLSFGAGNSSAVLVGTSG